MKPIYLVSIQPKLFVWDDCPYKLDRAEGVYDICEDRVSNARNIDKPIQLKFPQSFLIFKVVE